MGFPVVFMAIRCLLVVFASVLLFRGGRAADEEDQIVALLDDDVDNRDVSYDADSVAMHQEAAFHRFIDTHRKEYSKEEYGRRFEIYKDNLDFVRKFNSEGHGFHVAINELADLSDQEFAASYLNSELEEGYLSSSTYLSTSRSARTTKMNQKGANMMFAGTRTRVHSLRARIGVPKAPSQKSTTRPSALHAMHSRLLAQSRLRWTLLAANS